jgi:hypothetical protein
MTFERKIRAVVQVTMGVTMIVNDVDPNDLTLAIGETLDFSLASADVRLLNVKDYETFDLDILSVKDI